MVAPVGKPLLDGKLWQGSRVVYFIMGGAKGFPGLFPNISPRRPPLSGGRKPAVA